MRLRLALALTAFSVAPAIAQPGPAAPTGPAAPAARPANVTDDMAAFDKDVDALFGQGGLTADQAAARAAKVSPSARRKVAEVEAAIAQAESAELGRVPRVTASAGYTRLSHLDPLNFGGFSLEFPDNAYTTQAQLAIPLSDYLVRFPKVVGAARAATDAARTGKRSAEVNAGEDARLAYYEWIRAKLQVLVAQRQVAQVQTVLVQVRALAEVQRLSKADLMRVESQEAQTEQTLAQLKNLEALREEQLRILIGADEGEQLAAGEDVRVAVANASAGGSLEEAVSAAKKNRLELRALDQGIEAKEKQRDAAQADKYPRLTAFATADYANPNQRIFPQENKWDFTWQAGVQLSWTLNDTLLAGKTDDRIRAETDELRADKENLERGTRIEILAAQQAVILAQQNLATTAKGLAAAEEGYRVRRELLNAERATAVELVDAETDLTRARIAALNARVDLRVALTQLSHALGQDTGAAAK